MYGCCQICRTRTPKDTDGRTCEKIKAIVAWRGGVIRGGCENKNKGNYLWLCPLHWTLFERGLISIPLIENGENEEIVERIKKEILTINEQYRDKSDKDIIKYPFCNVEIKRIELDTKNIETIREDRMWFTKEHLKLILVTIKELFDNKQKMKME